MLATSKFPNIAMVYDFYMCTNYGYTVKVHNSGGKKELCKNAWPLRWLQEKAKQKFTEL